MTKISQKFGVAADPYTALTCLEIASAVDRRGGSLQVDSQGQLEIIGELPEGLLALIERRQNELEDWLRPPYK